MAACALALAAVPGACAKRDPVPADVLLARSVAAAVADGAWKEAGELAARAAAKDPANADAVAMAGLCRDREGDVAKAVEFYRRALSLDPRNFLASLLLGRALMDTGKPEMAFQHLQAAHEMKPESLEALVLLTRCAVALGKAEAAPLLKKLGIHPDFADKAYVFNERGVLYARAGDAVRAQRCFDEALRRNPAAAIPLLNKAVVADSIEKNPVKARACYNRYLNTTKGNDGLKVRRAEAQRRLDKINAASAPAP